MRHCRPRNIHTDYFVGRSRVVKHTRSSTPMRAIQHALRHLISQDYPGTTQCVIYSTNGRELATIKRTIGGWIVRV